MAGGFDDRDVRDLPLADSDRVDVALQDRDESESVASGEEAFGELVCVMRNEVMSELHNVRREMGALSELLMAALKNFHSSLSDI